jgi:hypothetical protein
MQFEDQSAAIRQMKELLRDQAKFRAKLDRVVRKIETSSQRTAKLAERNKTRKQSNNGNGSGKATNKKHEEIPEAVEQHESEKVHGDKIQAFDHDHEHGNEGDQQQTSGSDHELATAEHR